MPFFVMGTIQFILFINKISLSLSINSLEMSRIKKKIEKNKSSQIWHRLVSQLDLQSIHNDLRL
jgi:hypothetical protein